jgi:hypothetical protein
MGILARLAAKRRSRASGLLATHQPQELGFVNVAVFDEAGDQPKWPARDALPE